MIRHTRFVPVTGVQTCALPILSDTFGLRTAGFLTQYVPYEIDSGYFGFRPILDSAIILLSISSYGSDTLTSQEYNVYEVVSNKYLTEKPVESGKSERDTTFYLNFDPVKAGVVGDDVLFTFTFPDGKPTGPATDRKSTRLNSSHWNKSRMPSSA